MSIKGIALLIAVVVGLWLLAGCDAVNRHKFMSTVFDGYPSLPPAEEYCADFRAEAGVAADVSAAVAAVPKEVKNPSKHRPYAEKACNDCHDKQNPGGLLLPARELCFHCHKNFIRGTQVHGPVVVGECLSCHLPHSASYPSLLKTSKSEICTTCHKESRLAAGMHQKVAESKMDCVDCHDPHYGNARYFLK